MKIDVNFDFRSDARGKDPDLYSKTLRGYHLKIWNKPLPDGSMPFLEDLWPVGYIQFITNRGIFHLSSDTLLRTFANHNKMHSVIEKVSPAIIEEALRKGYTMGGMILFPRNKVDGKQSINQARGWNRSIEDRFDLTLECIRRFYEGLPSPLTQVLERYSSFFELFGNFSGYVDFFLLNDLVADNGQDVHFWAQFDNFQSSPLPHDIDTYVAYLEKMLSWISRRNERILNYLNSLNSEL